MPDAVAGQRDRHLNRNGQDALGEFGDALQDIVETDLAEIDAAEFSEGVGRVRHRMGHYGRSSRRVRAPATQQQTGRRANGSSPGRAAARRPPWRSRDPRRFLTPVRHAETSNVGYRSPTILARPAERPWGGEPISPPRPAPAARRPSFASAAT
ncbi:Protein of unknown function [Micromonospora lupini str. Lupac 08]|uniref:Uncharacterized protein n=1 Tax=Micromonospora lupini str. Lupac 08 TaxID=1150864 RepID=I0L6U7_9ACTN|nr:Protein of unknown function [Micromonospora lupini str. Lupac 08]